MALYEVFVDGAARGVGVNGKHGHGACAILIYKNKKLIGQFARGLGLITNVQAEYEAVIHGLLMCWSAQLEDPIIYSDAKVVVNQINGEWQCKNQGLLPLLYSVKEIQESYRFRVVHVPRKEVAEADALANDMLDRMLEPKARSRPKPNVQKDRR